MEVPHIHHGVDEYLVFTGTELEKIFDTGLEVDLFLGWDIDRMEKFTITKPTVVRVPPNMWHCPINFKKVGRGVNFNPGYLDPTWSKITRRLLPNGHEEYEYQGSDLRHCVLDHDKMCTYCGKCFSDESEKADELVLNDDFLAPYYEMGKAPKSGRVDPYFYEIPPDFTDLGASIVSPRAIFPGQRAIDGANLRFSYNVITAPVQIGDGPIMHDSAEEYLMFFGNDLLDIWGSFDAEIEIWLGDAPDHMERFVITEPATVAVLPGMWRGPINVRRVGRPFNFNPWQVDGKWSKVSKRTVGGEELFVYEGEGLTKAETLEDRLFSGE
jgi:hypothetical protein